MRFTERGQGVLIGAVAGFFGTVTGFVVGWWLR